MRTELRIRFDGNDVPGGAQTVLDSAGCGSDVVTITEQPAFQQVDVCVTLDEADPRASVLLEHLTLHDVLWWEEHDDRYTDEELSGAQLLFMSPNREHEIDGGAQWGMSYDLSEACPDCGTGARQTSPVLVSGKELAQMEGHPACVTWFGHVLVDESLATALENVRATGLHFRSVYAVLPNKRQMRVRWKQLSANHTLRRMSRRTTGLIRNGTCDLCRRNGYFRSNEEPTRIVYKASTLQSTDDVNVSWENTWHAAIAPDLRDRPLSSPWLVVTPKVWRVFRDAGVTAFDWLPVRIENE